MKNHIGTIIFCVFASIAIFFVVISHLSLPIKEPDQKTTVIQNEPAGKTIELPAQLCNGDECLKG